MHGQGPTLLSVWDATVAAGPRRAALIEAKPGGRVFSRARIDRLGREFAAKLPASISAQRVVFALPNGAGWLAVFLGLLRAGATPAPLDPSEPVANQLRLARACGAAFAWIDGRLHRVDKVRKRATGAARAALVKLTSGSSGTPRALPFSDAQMLADGRNICATMGIRPRDRNLAVIPFGHSYGLGNLVLPLLAQGSPIVCVELPLPHAVASAVARHRATIFPAVPALLRALADSTLPPDALKSLRTVISAGSPLPAATAGQFSNKFGISPRGFYGSSETGGIAYDRDGQDTRTGRSVGTALEGVTITPLRGGRIRVRGAAVGKTSGHVPADLARIETDGRVVLLGRAGRMVKIAGRRLDLGELEHALRRVPGIADAYVAPHPTEPDQLAAALATALAAGEVRALLRGHLALWQIPRRLVVLPGFPLTARGKPDLAALRDLLSQKVVDATGLEPVTPSV